MDTLQDTYESFCDELWRDWLADRLAPSAFVGRSVERDSAPEPWLEFHAGLHPLVVLTTNPGGGLEHQQRDAIIGGGSVIKPLDGYRAATDELAHFYETTPKLKRGSAHRRIVAFLSLAKSAGYDGVLQVESYPFHSASFPREDKNALLRVLKTDSLLQQYIVHLHNFLKARPVVAVCAVSTRTSLDATGLTALSDWLTWQTKLIGLEPSNATHVELVSKDQGKRKITAAALVDSVDGASKALAVMMGTNQLPGKDGLQLLANRITRVRSDLERTGI